MELDDEPDPLPEIESDLVRLQDYPRAVPPTRPAGLDDAMLRVLWPADWTGERKKVVVPVLVFIDDAGVVRDAVLVEDNAPRPFVDAALSAILAVRVLPAVGTDGPVPSRLFLVVRFGYD